jgi:hypothetical protein
MNGRGHAILAYLEDDAKLDPNVGHKVEIGGTVDPRARLSSTSTPGETSTSANAPRLKVDTVHNPGRRCGAEEDHDYLSSLRRAPVAARHQAKASRWTLRLEQRIIENPGRRGGAGEDEVARAITHDRL